MNWSSLVEEWILTNPLPCGDSWDITIMSSAEFKVERKVSVAFLHANEFNSDVIVVVGKNMKNRRFARYIDNNSSSSKKLIRLLKKFCFGAI